MPTTLLPNRRRRGAALVVLVSSSVAYEFSFLRIESQDGIQLIPADAELHPAYVIKGTGSSTKDLRVCIRPVWPDRSPRRSPGGHSTRTREV